MGSFDQAIESYNLPVETSMKLKLKVANKQYDDLVEIRRDSITGLDDYGPEINRMHFGSGKICVTTDRSKWKDEHVERALVYCADGTCLLIPTVCRNVSLITKRRMLGAGGGSVTPMEGGGVDRVYGLNQVPALEPVPTSFEAQTEAPSFGLSAPPGVAGTSPSPTMWWPSPYLPPLPPRAPVPSIPEPSTWLLLLGGFAMIALLKYRRK
jgi:hypothetical protein